MWAVKKSTRGLFSTGRPEKEGIIIDIQYRTQHNNSETEARANIKAETSVQQSLCYHC